MAWVVAAKAEAWLGVYLSHISRHHVGRDHTSPPWEAV